MSTNFPHGDDEIKRLYLVRGLPGSGKTTFASHLPAEPVEADDFFQSKFGWNCYQFDKKFIQDAHDLCRARTAYLIKEKLWVAVANTFTTAKEMEPYFRLAQRHGYEVIVFEMTGEYGNVHNVPDATIERMRNRWETDIFPKWWKGGREYHRIPTDKRPLYYNEELTHEENTCCGYTPLATLQDGKKSGIKTLVD